MSSTATDVVHAVIVDDLKALPVASAGNAAAVIEDDGNTVPVAIFFISSVQVGEVPSAMIDHPVMVPPDFALM